MKRRVLSFLLTLALCLNLCPVGALAADAGTEVGLCPHHPAHTDECGYVLPVPEQECTHSHDESCCTDATECTHEHDDTCGYVAGVPGAPCTFVCRLCPIEDLLGELPDSVSEENAEQVQAQVEEIFALYNELTEDELEQVDLTPCLDLLEQIDGLGAEVLDFNNGTWMLEKNYSKDSPYVISNPAQTINIYSYTLTGTGTGDNASAIRVTGQGELTLIGPGTVISQNGAGVEVQSGGKLSITEPVTVQGTTCALDIANGAEVKLSAGTYRCIGSGYAIKTSNNNFAALLAEGYAYRGEKGLISPDAVAKAKTVIVQQCTDETHAKGHYTHAAGTPTHTWTCAYCATQGSEPCTFTFDENGAGTCPTCGNTLSISVDESDLTDLVYDGNIKPQDVKITVALTDGSNKVLTKGTDYEVKYEPRKDAGEIKVTVTGKTFNGAFVKTYTVEKATPGISWNDTTKSVDYDGQPVEASDLPAVNKQNIVSGDEGSLTLKYQYKRNGDENFTDGLPKDAGTYQVKACLEGNPNYVAVETNPLLTLTINKIAPIVTAPAAKTLTYNRNSQELVTAGTLNPVAIADGLEIQFATEETGDYSTAIPTGTNARDYDVWYKVEGTGNYNAVGPTQVSGVEIQRKKITPTITAQPASYVYDGSKKEPAVTVKDGTFVLDEDQYTVTWAGTKNQVVNDLLRLADTYTATIRGKTAANGGNYEFTATTEVEITLADQNALKITGKPTLPVHYGDTITTLDTSGGTANGTVTWSITAGGTNSNIDSTGQLTVKDVGSITVKAERAVPNYGTVSDTWTFTVEPKPVTAVVTVSSKTYDGTTDIADTAITAEVNAADLVGSDTVTLSGLKGTYDNANAGTGKTVTLDDTNATKADGSGKYTISYPATTKGDITPKNVTVTVTLSESSYTYDGSAKKPDVTVTGVDGTYNATLAASDYSVNYSNNVNYGTATVTVTAKTGGNYTFTDATANFTINKEQAKVTAAPEARELTYNTKAQNLVTAGTASGGTMVYRVGDTGDFKPGIPEETNTGTYKVYYKVQGDANHSDSTEDSVEVTIVPKTVKDPTIKLSEGGTPVGSGTYTYDGSKKEPVVQVIDGDVTINPGEYTVAYIDNTDAGVATVEITDNSNGNYIVTGSTTFRINKANIVFNPAPSAATLTYDGTAQELLVPGTTSGGTVYYALGTSTSEYHDYIPTGVNAGSYKVYYKVTGDKNHNDFPITEVPVTIQRKPLTTPTIELTPNSFKYDGAVHLPAVTVKDGDTALPASEYSWACNVSDPKDGGTYTVTVSDAAGGNYDLTGANPNTATFTIGKTAQAELVIEGKPAVTNYGDTFTLTTSGGSGNGAVTWSVTGPVTMNNGTLTITGTGDVNVTVVKAADTNYQQTSAHWTFTAAPKPVTASVTVNNKSYDGTTAATVTAASITTINSDTVTIDPASITAAFDTANVGTDKTVTLDTSKVQVTGDDAAKYDISYPATVTAKITQATTTITTNPAKIDPLTYNGQPQELVTAGVTNVGFLVYSLDGTDFSQEIPTGTDAGTYTVYYKVDETADYTGVAVNAPPVSVTIGPKTITPTIIPASGSYTFDGADKKPEITVKDGDVVIGTDQYTVTWRKDGDSTDTDIVANAGTYTATIKNVDNGNYTFTATAKVTIVAATQDALKITNKPQHVYYGDSITLDTTGGTGEGTVEWSIAPTDTATTIDTNGKLTVKATGTFTVTATRKVLNYGDVSDTWEFTVKPKPVVAEVTVAEKTYDGGTAATVTATVSDLVDPGDSFTISGLTGVFENANVGTGKTVTLDSTNATADNTDKYAVSYPTTAKGDINPKNVTVTVTLSDHDLQGNATDGYYYEYDGTEKKPNVTVTGTADDGYSATLAESDYSVSYANNKNVSTATVKGTVTVTASTGGNYTFTAAPVNFEIRSAGAVLTSSPQAKDLTYEKGKEQELVTVGTATGGTVMYSKTGAEGSYSETIPTGENAGTYTVYYMVKGDANHDDTTPQQMTATIKPKEITPAITLDTDSYEYDGAAKTPTVTVKDGETVIDGPGTSKPEYSVSYRDNVNVGTATVVISDANGGNYTVNGTASFTITKAAPTVTAPTGKTDLKYNGASQELVNAGVTGDGTVEYSVNGGNYSAAIPTASAVGEYEIKYMVKGDANHSDTTAQTLTVKIDKNTVTDPTITLSQNQFTYDGNQHRPTVTIYDGSSRLIPEHEYTVDITGTNGNVGMVDVDTYTVKVTTPDTSNYVISGNNTRTFDIVKADQETISITGTKTEVRYGDTIQLGTTGGVGGSTVKWEITGNTATTLTQGGLLTVKDVNTPIKVTVTRSRGGNYTDVSATWEFTAAKKPVTAVVTATDRNYAENDKSATVTASVPNSELVSGDSITISGLTGEFDNPNVGADKKVTVNSSSPTVTGTNSEKYDITYPATTTASILGVAATVDTAPGDVTPSLTYDASQSQELVTAGAATGGIMVYSLDGKEFTPNIPKGKDAGTYKVYYKVQGDQNHTDSAVGTVDVTIGKQTVTPQIELSPPSGQYDGKVQQPKVTVRDGANNVIPTSEYKVTYVTDGGKNWKDQGTYTVKVENITGGNYEINTATKDFVISTSAQAPLEITGKPGLVYYGDTFTLSATGGSGNEKVTWSSSNESIAHVDDNGLVTIKGTGSAIITATKPGGTNYGDATATYPLNALKKPVTAIVSADDKVYDGNTNATIHVTWNGLVGSDTINTSALSGEFDTADVGTGKTVTVTGNYVDDATAQKYDITVQRTTTASITKTVVTAPTLTANNREYDGSAQTLVTGGDANTLYSDSQNGVYSATVPQGTNAGTYNVWYKEKGDTNHNDSEPQGVTVTISPKELTNATIELSGNGLKADTTGATTTYYYEYDSTEKRPDVVVKDGAREIPASEYSVSYSNNTEVSTDAAKATVTITDNPDGNYTVSGSTTFEIRKGKAQLTSPPTAKTLTYTGAEQELVFAGAATGGKIGYSKDGSNFIDTIPQETNAGTYTVYYKVLSDDGGKYEESAVLGSVSVTISPKTVVSPVITVSGGPYTYDSNPQIPTTVTVMDGTETIPASNYTLSYRDNVNAGTATVIVTNANGGNYIVNGTGTFEIDKAAATVGTAPTGKTDLKYNGTDQALAEAGSASGGTMVYSLSETGEYSAAIPTGKEVKGYTVYYKVQGDANHADSEAQSVTASIAVNTVTNPTIQVTPASVKYTGEKQEPTVTVKDDAGLLIDGSEYTVTYADTANGNNSDLIKVGTYTVTVTGKDTNYSFSKPATFTIVPADQTALTITGKRERVYYGDTIQLGTEGGDGTVTWDLGGSTIATITNGLLKITGLGSVTVTATSSKTGYEDKTATWQFYAEKKPTTAVVTAVADQTYDGTAPATTEVTAKLQSGDLVGTDDITITLTGTFDDPNAGTNKRVSINSTSPNFDGSTGNHENYNITYPVTATGTIRKANIDETKVNAPTAEETDNLEYTGLPLPLVTAGSVTDNTGTMEYSLDNVTYSASLPTGTNAGNYDVWYRVKGDSNHNDTAGTKLATQVNIAPQTVDAPTIEFNPTGASYDGSVHKPAVTVKDANNRVIPDNEYTVTYSDTDWKSASTATVKHIVTVTNKDGGNYNITTKEQEFIILVAGQSPLSITNKPGKVQYGDSFTLSATGGSGTGKLVWSITDNGVAQIDQNGLVKVLKSGSATVTVKREADGGYGEVSDSWSFSAEKKPVTPIVTAKDKEYDGSDTAQLVIKWKDGDLLSGDTISLSLTGKFDNANVGTGKEVTITGTAPASDKYDIQIPASTTASITPKAASVTGVTAVANLEYTGVEQNLVSGGTATGGTLMYSLDGVVYYPYPNVPTGKNAGRYTVYYKVQADVDGNYKDSPVTVIPVTISPKTLDNPEIELSPDTFDYDGTPKKPDVVVKDGSVVIPASEYMVSYSNNTAVGTATVTISNAPNGNYNVNGSQTFTIKAGAASLVSAPQPNNRTYDGTAQPLVMAGSAVNGKVVYSLTSGSGYSTTIPSKTDAGTYTVYYKVQGENGAADTTEAYVAVTIARKAVTPTVLVGGQSSYSVTYTGSAQTPAVTVIVDGQQITQNLSVSYSNNTNVGTATVTLQSTGGNYQFYLPVTFEITKGKASFLREPQAKTDLYYIGEPQELVRRGTANNGGIVLYSLDNVAYSTAVPTGIDRGTYTVYAKIQASELYAESDVVILDVEIGKNIVTDTPDYDLSATNFPYTGSEVQPTVTLWDDDGYEIDSSEYTLRYSNNIAVGTATIKVTCKRNGNYSFNQFSITFTIVDASQTPLAITGKQDTVYYGDTLSLGTTGGGSGTVTWSSSGPVTSLADGQYKVNSSGSVTITAAKGSSTDVWTFYAKPKPVTATVYAADKVYDNSPAATLTVTLSGLLPGESVSLTANGNFIDEKVGTNKTVLVTSLNGLDGIKDKYTVTHNSTTTASITPKPATVLDTDKPTLAGSLTYNGGAQALLASGGTAASGNLMYSLDGREYSYTIPTGTDAKTYTVWYKVEASDENHKDSTPVKLGTVTISANPNAPSAVQCNPSSFSYDGTEKTPTVVVLDSTGQHIVPESEYTVTFESGTRIAVGKYKVTVTDKPGGNYEFTSPVTVADAFEIVSASQNPLSIITDKHIVYYGETFRLSEMGGSGSGAIHWSIKESNGVATVNNGVVTVTGTGSFTVEAYKEASDGYSKSNTVSVPFEAKPKPVTPVVTASDKSYNGNTDATLTASVRSSDLVNSTDNITLSVQGVFASADAGTNKRVNLKDPSVTGTDAAKYTINWPDSVTATINRVDAKIAAAPAAVPNLVADGTAKDLVSAGTTVNGIGTIVYSLDQNGTYSADIPKATAAGTYTVWYKVADSVNYNGVPAASVTAEIKEAPTSPVTPPSEDVSSDAGTSISSDTMSTYSTPARTTVRNGAASTVLSASEGSSLVRQAAANQSQSIVVQPKLSDDVTKTAVAIPASTVSQINSQTDADLTVASPIADVTIPNTALGTLSNAGGTVDVVTEQKDNAVTLTLTADGEKVEKVPGGVTLSVPVENAGPGTVAVVVHEDGTRETVRKSVAGDGKVNVPLDGSATVEIVDNSKDFTDVPDTNWAADAVDFASARELFNGTSETEFSPDQPMSRGMLATVLYNLEGCPAQDKTSAFSDVSSDAWYADGVAWAAENGIADGNENGQFGPDESITREQFAVMLWKYAGSPKASGQDLAFTDAGQASSYAREALCWAVENGILSGCGNGQLAPGETATRAQAAQMLKKFMENI